MTYECQKDGPMADEKAGLVLAKMTCDGPLENPARDHRHIYVYRRGCQRPGRKTHRLSERTAAKSS